MKQKFKELHVRDRNRIKLDTVNEIIDEYNAQGYILTLRQLYYQLVSRDIIANSLREYQKLSILLVQGRMAGIIDWSAIEDRVRRPRKVSTFDSIHDLLKASSYSFKRDKTDFQHNYIELWVEKDALSGIFSKLVNKWNINILVNRGYSSASAMYDSYNRFKDAIETKEARAIKILYLGDFDPSGEDMVRDIRSRIEEFWEGDSIWDGVGGQFDFSVEKIALNPDQIKQYNPPPNPAKVTDPRAKDFIAKYGTHSWEVDALRPDVLNQLVEDSILKYMDIDKWNRIKAIESFQQANLDNFINTFRPDHIYEDALQKSPELPDSEMSWEVDVESIEQNAYIFSLPHIVEYRYWRDSDTYNWKCSVVNHIFKNEQDLCVSGTSAIDCIESAQQDYRELYKILFK